MDILVSTSMKTTLQSRNSLKWLLLTFFSILVTNIVAAQSVQEEWSRRYGGQLPSQINNIKLAVDSNGNSYIGSSQDDVTGKHVVLVKYSPTGEELWSKRLHDNPDATLGDIAVDAEGSIYTASIVFSGSNYVGVLSKHSALDGATLWEEVLRDGRNVGNVEVIADNKGGIFVTVYANQLFLGATTLVKKFNSQNGALLWEKDLLALSIAGIDYPADFRFTSIALDNEGDAYITGTVETTTVPMQISTLKLSGTDGSLVWSKKLHTPALQRVVTQIALDNSGGVYIAGFSYTTDFFTPENIFVVKFQSSNGEQVWMQEAATVKPVSPAPVLADLLTDNAGGVYLATNTGGESLLVKRKASDGKVDWTATFEGTILSLAVDRSGGVYAAGMGANADYVIMKYNSSNGQLQWHQVESGNNSHTVKLSDMVLSESGNLLVAGINTHIFIAKHESSDGSLIWKENVQAGTPAYDSPVVIKTDGEGNVVVAGNSTSATGGIASAFVIKYAETGETLWLIKLEAGRRNEIVDMAVDDKGHVYVLGTNVGSDSRPDIILRKYDGVTGNLIWDAAQGMGQANFGGELKLDGKGNVYISGLANSMFDVRSMEFISKVNAETGETIWQKIYSSEIANSELHDLVTFAPDKEGNVYVTGIRASTSTNNDVITLKYGTDGSIIWRSVLDKTVNDAVRFMDIDHAGGVFLAGYSYVDQTQNQLVDPFLLKYNSSDGAQVWQKTLLSAGSSKLFVAQVLASDEGRVYVRGTDLSEQVFAFNSSTGKQEWSLIMGGFVSDMAIDGTGGLYISKTITTNEIQKYNAVNGQKVWSMATEQEPRKLTLDDQLNIFVAGVVTDPVTHWDMLTTKYSQTQGSCHIPVQVRLYLPPVAKRVGWQVRTTADFRPYILGADHGVRWTWGDGTASTIAYTAHGTSRITGEHTYSSAGIYPIGLDFSQSCLSPNNEGYEQWMPVFDPEAGFVTGAGQAAANGKRLGFNFSVRYSGKYAVTPTGQTHLQITGLGMFRSSSLDWLVVTGDKAAWRGEGTIDGKGRYGFIASVTDAGNPGQDDPGDRLRVLVWDMDRHNRLVYNSFTQGGEILNLSNQGPAIDRGNIVIHGQNNGSITAKGGSKVSADAQELLLAYPNTFSESTTISFSVERGQAYTLEVYDTKGRLVRELATGTAEAGGTQKYVLRGESLSEGLYIARLVTSAGSQSIKVLLKR